MPDPRDGEGRGGSCCTRGAAPARQTRQLLPLRILSLLRHPQAMPPPTHLLQLSLEDNESIKHETLLGIFPTSGPGGKQSTGYKKAGSTLGILMHSKTNCSKTSLFLSPNERYTHSVFLRNNQVQSRNEEALLSSAGEATGCPSRGASTRPVPITLQRTSPPNRPGPGSLTRCTNHRASRRGKTPFTMDLLGRTSASSRLAAPADLLQLHIKCVSASGPLDWL